MTAISGHAGPQFYYGPMPVPPTPAMVNPYFLSMGSGPLPVNSSPLMDRGGSLVSIPSGPYGGAAPSHVSKALLVEAYGAPQWRAQRIPKCCIQTLRIESMTSTVECVI